MAQQSATSPAPSEAARASIEVPPCPAWCEREAGHEYDRGAWAGPPWTFTRTHSREIGVVEVCSVEENTAGSVSFWEAFCAVDNGALNDAADIGEKLYGVDRLRLVMADMAKAAELLDEIKAAQS